MQWNSQQDAALRSVRQWLRTPGSPQVFRLFGFAGTGKTTLAKELENDAMGDVLFAAPTGKAALVLQKKGCRGASTVHSLIYRRRHGPGPARFTLNHESELNNAAALFLDEGSMINEEVGRDVLSFGKKVLVMADTFQLPPVSGYGYFTEAAPEIMLTDVRRQAENNPIIRMSLDIREGRSLAYGSYGDSRVVRRSQINSDEVLSADQVLVGTNKTRFKFNGRVRELRGFATRQGRNDALPMNPVRGDRLVCLKNDRNKGLLNGGLWSVERVELNRRGNYVMQLVSLDLDSRGRVTSSVETPPAFFDGTFADLPWEERKNCDEFDFGYALTVHKSQGSQFDNPMLFDESDVFGENAARHRYTGVTRAVDTITIVR